MSTPDPRTERAQLDKWLLQTNRYPGTVTAGEAAQHLYDAAAKANDALTTEAARHVGKWSTARPTVAGWYWLKRESFEPCIVEVLGDDVGGLTAWFTGDEMERFVESITGEWCPIARPGEEG